MNGPELRIGRVELVEVALPLVRPFRTSFGTEREKRALLVHLEGDGVEGWGECAASAEPDYSEEWLDGCRLMLREFLVPLARGGRPIGDPEDLVRRLAGVRGNRMAKAALEMAVLDAWLRLADRSLGAYLGADRERVPCGVSVGIAPSIDAMLEEIDGYVRAGYRRVKLKIEPGRDVEIVRAVREALPDMPLTVDANAAYRLEDAPVLEALDEFGLLFVEQPLHHEDLAEHAELARRIRTTICLDESIRSARDAVAAIEMGACGVINIKPGRVGGLLEARRVHDAARDREVPVWIGGMLETGIGRAANVAMAALPGVAFPGDTSASARYFPDDLTEPFVLGSDGTLAVPTGPGLGVEPRPERLAECTSARETVPA